MFFWFFFSCYSKRVSFLCGQNLFLNHSQRKAHHCYGKGSGEQQKQIFFKSVRISRNIFELERGSQRVEVKFRCNAQGKGQGCRVRWDNGIHPKGCCKCGSLDSGIHAHAWSHRRLLIHGIQIYKNKEIYRHPLFRWSCSGIPGALTQAE